MEAGRAALVISRPELAVQNPVNKHFDQAAVLGQAGDKRPVRPLLLLSKALLKKEGFVALDSF